MVGFEGGNKIRGYWCFGWPCMYHMRSQTWENVDGSLEPNSRWYFGSDLFGGEQFSELATMPSLEFSEPSVARMNAYLAILILGCTCFVMISTEFSRFPRQWTLRQLMAVVVLAAVLLGLIHSGPLPWWPVVTWKPLVFFPILFGLICTAMTVDLLLARSIGFIVRRYRDRVGG